MLPRHVQNILDAMSRRIRDVPVVFVMNDLWDLLDFKPTDRYYRRWQQHMVEMPTDEYWWVTVVMN